MRTFFIDHTAWIVPFILLCAPVHLCGQDSVNRGRIVEEMMERAYGPDQSLINGLQFYDRYLGVMGHPYLGEDRFREGTVTIEGYTHKGLELKYDLVRQEVVVKYNEGDGSSHLVVTVPEHVEEFTVGPVLFMRLKMNGAENGFYQVVRTEQFDGFIRWEKKRVMVNGDTRYREKCTKANCHYMVRVNEELKSFRNRRGFLRCFPDEWRRELRALMRTRNVQFGEASPEEIIRWLQAASDTIGKLPPQ